MKRFWLVVLILVMASLACGASTRTAADYAEEYGGNVEVYQHILSLEDCAALQAEFDQAEANLTEPGTPSYRWGLGYMQAADARMKEIGCYE